MLCYEIQYTIEVSQVRSMHCCESYILGLSVTLTQLSNPWAFVMSGLGYTHFSPSDMAQASIKFTCGLGLNLVKFILLLQDSDVMKLFFKSGFLTTLVQSSM
ncbi:hypothetical protein AQUCO_01700458v1 [Aquilegia coerulea]|uniref:Uncharacterized protein n=1 Tax=Aquilegia coerulea TaxID=218851 RepID=A0A2G5DMZ1_AQUCA|nr:hypothetical protein AQUCO_01700458v1 [Aquilegia coerulea]PIA44890.1 hypothetical protein AQUCO_01700458v1 [Aquilegia coerulea]